MSLKLAAVLFCLSGLVKACSCVEHSQDTARSAAYAIFDGTVTNITISKTKNNERCTVGRL